MSLTYRVASVCRMTFIVLVGMGWAGAHAFAARHCSAPWPTVRPDFISRVEYGDAQRKSDPYIVVSINDKPAKMLLDTGSNVHVLWDNRLLAEEEDHATENETLNAIASSTQAKRTLLPLSDGTGHRSAQQFYVIDETPLMADGFSGIISPQYLAQEKVSILDFKDDCFFVSERFDPEGGGRYGAQFVGTVPNPHRVMAIPLDVPGGRVPVVVDSGAYRTTLLGSLLRRAIVGRQRTTNVDLLGNLVASKRRTRLVDITVNGQRFLRHPVVPAPTISDKGVVTLGAVGMDVLAGRVIFHDGDLNRFAFVALDGHFEAAH